MKPHQVHATQAFTVTEMLLVVACLLLLAALILPLLARSHVRGSPINCTNNLKQLGLAFRTWALDNNDKFPMEISVKNGGAMELINTGAVFAVFQVMSNELSTPQILYCPAEDPKRIKATTFQSTIPMGTPPYVVPFTSDNNVSYFVGVDANQTKRKWFCRATGTWLSPGFPSRMAYWK